MRGIVRDNTAGLPAVVGEWAKEASREGGSNSVVESQPSKLLVAGSIPVSRSSLRSRMARVREATAGKPLNCSSESWPVRGIGEFGV